MRRRLEAEIMPPLIERFMTLLAQEREKVGRPTNEKSDVPAAFSVDIAQKSLKNKDNP